MFVLFGRRRSYEGLEAVVRETQNVGSGPLRRGLWKTH